MNYTLLMLGLPSIIRSFFNAVFVIILGWQFPIHALSRITVTIIAFQLVESFSSAGVDSIIADLLNKQYEASDLWKKQFLVRSLVVIVFMLPIGGFLGPKLDWGLFINLMLCLIISSGYSIGFFIVGSQFLDMLLFISVYLLGFIAMMLFVCFFKANVFYLLYWSLIGPTCCMLRVRKRTSMVANNQITIKAFALRMIHYLYVNGCNLIFTSFASFLISLSMSPKVIVNVFYLDRIKSIYKSIMVPASKSVLAILIHSPSDRLNELYKIWSLIFVASGCFFSMSCLIFYSQLRAFLFPNLLPEVHFWALSYLLQPAIGALPLFFLYALFPLLQLEQYISKVMLISAAFFIPFLTLGCWFKSIQILALGMIISEVFVCLKLFNVARKKIYSASQMEKISE